MNVSVWCFQIVSLFLFSKHAIICRESKRDAYVRKDICSCKRRGEKREQKTDSNKTNIICSKEWENPRGRRNLVKYAHTTHQAGSPTPISPLEALLTASSPSQGQVNGP